MAVLTCAQERTLEPPRLIEATPAALLTLPRAPLDRPGYRLLWSLPPAPGGCALQRVETRVRFLRGEEALVEYRAVYWEWFEFAGAGQALVDCHDFDLLRDGWSPERMWRLGAGTSAGPPARVVVEKRFLFGAGALEGEVAVRSSPLGVGFGFLRAAEDEPSALQLTVAGRDALAGARPLPGPASGRGRFTGARLCCVERLEWTFATLAGQASRTEYEPEHPDQEA